MVISTSLEKNALVSTQQLISNNWERIDSNQRKLKSPIVFVNKLLQVSQQLLSTQLTVLLGQFCSVQMADYRVRRDYAAISWQYLVLIRMVRHQLGLDAVQCWAWWVTAVKEVKQLLSCAVWHVAMLHSSSDVVGMIVLVTQSDYSWKCLIQRVTRLWSWLLHKSTKNIGNRRA